MAARKPEAESAFRHFQTAWRPKYPQAVECLAKDREELLALLRLPDRAPGALAADDESDRVRWCGILGQ